MIVYLVIKLFGVIAVVASTPYNLAECRDSLALLNLPADLEATAECVESAARPEVGELTREQQEQVDHWIAQMGNENG